jgi:hypothetical protein
MLFRRDKSLCSSVKPPALAGQVLCFSVKFSSESYQVLLLHGVIQRIHRETQRNKSPKKYFSFFIVRYSLKKYYLCPVLINI